MNGRVAKKIRKYSRQQFQEYLEMIRELPFLDRLYLAWHIVFK